ncbi:hypothetical protein DL768_002060 [Monosporascus sp. mg162]|nr:hypothetical protein DL768_002060 [Monosporascus sp. mg162]
MQLSTVSAALLSISALAAALPTRRFRSTSLRHVMHTLKYQGYLGPHDSTPSFREGTIIDVADAFKRDDIDIDVADAFKRDDIDIDVADAFKRSEVDIDIADAFKRGDVDIDVADAF